MRYYYVRIGNPIENRYSLSAFAVTSRLDVTTGAAVRSALFADGFGATALRTADGEIDRGDGDSTDASAKGHLP